MGDRPRFLLVSTWIFWSIQHANAWLNYQWQGQRAARVKRLNILPGYVSENGTELFNSLIQHPGHWAWGLTKLTDGFSLKKMGQVAVWLYLLNRLSKTSGVECCLCKGQCRRPGGFHWWLCEIGMVCMQPVDQLFLKFPCKFYQLVRLFIRGASCIRIFNCIAFPAAGVKIIGVSLWPQPSNMKIE